MTVRFMAARGVRFLSLIFLSLGISMATGCAEMSSLKLGDIFSLGAPLDQETVARGLRQALDVGTQRTVATLSEPGGFGGNSDLRIGMPKKLASLASALRAAGLGAKVDALENSMNQAAEQSVAKAGPIFISAIASMSITDAFEILNGSDDAATRYFEKETSKTLRKEFSPVVSTAMQDVGLYRSYLEILALYDAIPFSRLPDLDLEDYVADQTLDALFAELAKEEAAIREDPAARSTALLRRVFGATPNPTAETATQSEPR